MANPSKPISSPDISTLSFSILYDISGAVPTLALTNLSTVIHANNLKWWYVVTTPSGTPVHQGSLSNPDVNHIAWTVLNLPANSWPLLFGTPPCAQIEFSPAAPYVCTLYVIDSANNTYSLAITQIISRPYGSDINTCGSFGAAQASVNVNCNEKSILCTDATVVSYQNVASPSVQVTNWTLVYPQGPGGNQPANGTASGTSYVKFPISSSGDGYVVFLQNYCTYDMGNGATIKLQYKAINPDTNGPGIPFAVLCNIDLCKLQCQIQTFYQLSKKKCGQVENEALLEKMTKMNFLFNQAIIGILQPLCGIKVPEIVKEIQSIGDLDENCDCGCHDKGVNFSYPTNGNGTGTGGCCPVSTNVIDKGTGIAPALCPNSYFPVNVYDPTGITKIGTAYEINGLVALLNSYPAWAAYGTAFAQGNCKVGWFASNTGTIPDIKVDVLTNAQGDNGNNGTGGGSGGGTFQVDIYVHGTVNTPPPPCPSSYFPVNVYNYTDTAIIGTANSITDLINILNADPSWNTFGQWSAEQNCSTHVTLKDPSIFPTTHIFVELLPVDINVVTVDKKIVTQGTSTSPAECPGSYFPVKVLDYTGTIYIGVANNITELCTIINTNSYWLVYGTVAPIDNCNVRWTLADPNNIPPFIQVNTNVSDTTCLNGNQTYIITVNDICVTGTTVTSGSYPLNLYVNFGSGIQFVGNFATQAAAVIGLNAFGTKPASVTFSAGPTVDKIKAVNTNCTAFNSPISLTTDANSNSFLLLGANHSNLGNTTPTENGVFGISLKTDLVLGRIPGYTANGRNWHTVRVGSNTIVTVEANTGKVYFHDIANPLMPILLSVVTLTNPTTNSFTGTPSSQFSFTGPTCPSYFSLYMPTDFSSPMSLSNIYIFEGTTGTAWHIDQYGVLASFQDNKLLGKCPRVFFGNKIYFTQDGDMETYTASSGVAAGSIVKLDTTTFNSGGLSVQIIIQGENVWAASYDGANTIYFTSVAGSIATYSLLAQNVAVIHSGTLPGGTVYQKRCNTKWYMGELYTATVHAAAVFAPIINTSTFTRRDLLSIPPSNYEGGYNLLPLGNCLMIYTYLKTGGVSGGVALYKTDGTLVKVLTLDNFTDIYNLIPIANVNTETPNNFS